MSPRQCKAALFAQIVRSRTSWTSGGLWVQWTLDPSGWFRFQDGIE